MDKSTSNSTHAASGPGAYGCLSPLSEYIPSIFCIIGGVETHPRKCLEKALGDYS